MAEALPLFPLGTVLFPGMVLPLHIFEERYRLLLKRHLGSDPIFGVVLTRSGYEVGDEPEIHEVGTAASVLKAQRYGDGRIDLIVEGTRRFRVLRGHWDETYLTGTIEWIEEPADGRTPTDLSRLDGDIRRAFEDYLAALARALGARPEPVDLAADPIGAAYTICAMMPLDVAQRQRLLEASVPEGLLREVLSMLRRERELLLSAGIGGSAHARPASRFSAN